MSFYQEGQNGTISYPYNQISPENTDGTSLEEPEVQCSNPFPQEGSNFFPNTQRNNGQQRSGDKLLKPNSIIQPESCPEREEEDCDYLEGLPNLGNSCHLNSVLQFLFGAPAFREKIITYYQKKQNNDTVTVLGAIFQALKGKVSDETKRSLISDLTNHLLINPDFQDDAMRILTLILDQVEEDLRGEQSPRSMFIFESTQKCQCPFYQIINESLFFSVEPQMCARCHQIFIKKYLKLPKYLVFSGEIKNAEKFLYFLSGGKLYKFSSQVLYKGNEIHGHYVCTRSEGERRFLFNDDLVSLQDQSQNQRSLRGFKSKLLLYEQVQFEKYPELEENIESMRSQVISQCSYLDLVVQTKQVEDEIPPESPQVLRSMFRSWLWIFPPLVILLKIYDYTSRKNWFTLKAFGVLFVCCGLVGAICELVSNSSRSLIGRFFLKKPLAGKPENLSRGRKVERSLQRSRK